MIVKLQDKLRHSLERKALWTAGISLQAGGRVNTQAGASRSVNAEEAHVRFKEKVTVREYQKESPASRPGAKEPFFVELR